MRTACLLGLDVGGTAIKVGLFRVTGELLALEQVAIPIQRALSAVDEVVSLDTLRHHAYEKPYQIYRTLCPALANSTHLAATGKEAQVYECNVYRLPMFDGVLSVRIKEVSQ